MLAFTFSVVALFDLSPTGKAAQQEISSLGDLEMFSAQVSDLGVLYGRSASSFTCEVLCKDEGKGECAFGLIANGQKEYSLAGCSTILASADTAQFSCACSK